MKKMSTASKTRKRGPRKVKDVTASTRRVVLKSLAPTFLDLHSACGSLLQKASDETKKMVSAKQALKTLRSAETKDGWFDMKEEKKEERPESWKLLSLLRGSLFKADHPYSTRLCTNGQFQTSAIGVINVALTVNNIASTAEWGSIDALFDEFFVHSMTLRYFALNKHGSSAMASAGALGSIPVNITVTSYASEVGVVLASLFSAAGTYSSAAAMCNNASRGYRNTSDDWTYSWRNNVRFDPRGPSLSSATTESWAGWNLITNASAIGGQIQVRAINDQGLGSGSTVVYLGDYVVEWEVSFRARS